MGSVKDEEYKIDPHTLEGLTNNILPEIWAIFGENTHRVNTTPPAVLLSAFGQKGNIFSICNITGEFLSDFIKATVTANLSLASFTDS